jgi:hypothetical protein
MGMWSSSHAKVIWSKKLWMSPSKIQLAEVFRAYPNNPEALKAMRAQAKWRNAR